MGYSDKELNPKFGFFHVGRCAGSSMRIMLFNYFKQIFPENTIFIPEKTNNINHNLRDIREKKRLQGQFEKINVLLCHMAFNTKGVTEGFSERCFSCTIIRNPINRVLSQYYHFRFPKNQIPFYELPEEDIRDYLRIRGKMIINMLSGEIGDYSVAVENLEKITCLLRVENLGTDIPILNNQLNKAFEQDIKLHLPKLNETAHKPVEEDFIIVRERADLIEDLLIWDRKN